MAWTVDKGLDRLLAQINEAAPDRSKASDGSIGDADHAARASDHNPEDSSEADAPGNPDEQVDARDFTHDPAHGADMNIVAESIRKSKDRRVKYVIWNRRIYSGNDGPQPWVWRAYAGTNPHDHHMHVSVEDDTHDQTQDWSIGIGDDMALTTTDGVTLLKTDAIKNPAWRADSGSNPFVTWGFAVYDTWDQAHAALVAAQSAGAKVEALAAAFKALAESGTNVDTAVILAAVDKVGDELAAQLAEMTAERDALQARLAAALVPAA